MNSLQTSSFKYNIKLIYCYIINKRSSKSAVNSLYRQGSNCWTSVGEDYQSCDPLFSVVVGNLLIISCDDPIHAGI